MSDDPWEGFFDEPENEAWIKHVQEELVPMIRKTALTISLIPDEPRKVDIKFAVELGLSIMLDKPIIAVITPGMQVPGQLVRVAEEIVEWDGEVSPMQSQALVDAITRVHERHPRD